MKNRRWRRIFHRPRAWRLGGMGWRELARRVVKQLGKDEVINRAAQLAYFFLFSIFPLLLFFTALFGYLVEGSEELRGELFSYLREVFPNQAARDLVLGTLSEIRAERGGGKLSFGLLLSLLLASNGMAALISALNAAFDHTETRPFWQQRILALGLTVAFAALMIVSSAIVFYGSEIGGHLAGRFGLGSLFETLWNVGIWCFLLVGLLLTFDLIYNFAPNLKRRERRWLTPGAVVGVGLWLAGSLVFRVYLDHFNLYGRTYGSLGAVIVLMTWFLITGLALLLGGEVNSEISKAGRRRR
jgi:membrane protein